MIKWKNIEPAPEELPEENGNLNFVIQPNAANNIPSDNKIYLYSEINKDTVLTICKQIDEISKQLKLLQFTYDLTELPPIELHINSDGGDLSSSLVLVDKILKNKLPVYTYIEGMSASAATLISIVGKKRYISQHSYMLLHQLRSGGWGGTYQNIVDEKQNCDILMDTIKDIYLKHSKFREKDLKELLKHDLYISAPNCLKMGLVDEML